MFIIIRLRYFLDSLDIAMIVAPACEFFSVKCAQFPLICREWNQTKGNFSFGMVFIHFWHKPYQEINFKSHLNSVLLCK